MFANDLYVLLGDDDVFYLPTSKGTVSRISSINDSSHKVQRTAAINALSAVPAISPFVPRAPN